jgi:SAM-dependent methyltransferase
VTREQRTVFGEVAELYERTRPGYPEAVYDAIIDYGHLHATDRALEIGAGTGKATRAMAKRGLEITALEPSPGMAALLVRSAPVTVVETTFEHWEIEPAAFALVYAAQAWHWVDHTHAYGRAADALRTGGTIALVWNVPAEWDGALGNDIDAVYAQHAPALLRASEQWDLDTTLGELTASERFEDVTKMTFPWVQSYTTGEYVAMLGTHSNHRMLDDAARTRLHTAVGEVIGRHGGRVEVEYKAGVYLARRR